jgi:D-lactate dehydrogenase (cytochrome)
MDAVDLFVGSEGTLGIVTEIELRLAVPHRENLYLCQYFPDENAALAFVDSLGTGAEPSPLAIEYFDPNSIELLREKRSREGASSGVPELPGDAAAVVYTEVPLADGSAFEVVADRLERMAVDAGSSADRSWAGFQRKDHERMKDFRHALPETVNSIIAERKTDVPGLHKVGTDMAVPFARLREMMATYRERLDEAGYEYVIFGHIGDGHVHVNILPRSEEELAGAKKAYVEFARHAVRLGGSVSAEHGIGRLKKAFLSIQYPEDVIEGMRRIKRAFDPAGTLNPGVLF